MHCILSFSASSSETRLCATSFSPSSRCAFSCRSKICDENVSSASSRSRSMPLSSSLCSCICRAWDTASAAVWMCCCFESRSSSTSSSAACRIFECQTKQIENKIRVHTVSEVVASARHPSNIAALAPAACTSSSAWPSLVSNSSTRLRECAS